MVENRGSRVPEARYAYYRRCQVFNKNGKQCKAPAENGSHICYAHAGQQAMALRRKIELAVLLAQVVRRVRTKGKPQFEVADIFMDFNAIQITLSVMAQALIDGRIDLKTAGRLAIGLQTAAKLLRLVQKAQTTKARTTKDTKEHEEIRTRGARKVPERPKVEASEGCRQTGIHLIAARVFRPEASPYWARAA
ncbi:MAG TPA: hypothetical protein VFR84_06680 [Candidatus Angelobacter sp.]|nr:hypothetical protein [Candidatus Angelobacter sp.]